MTLWRALSHTAMAAVRDRGLLLMFVFAIPIYSLFYPLPYSTQAVRQIPVSYTHLTLPTICSV